MKKYITTVITILMIITLGHSQLYYEGTYDAAAKVFMIDDGSIKFYKFDSKNNLLSIYDADQTLWKSIELKIPKGHEIDDINIIPTASNENGDQLIILYTCYYQSNNYAIEDASEHFSKELFTLNVIDENGTVLLKVPEAREYKLLSNDGNRKVLVYKSGNIGFKSKNQVEVYAFNNK